MEDVKKIQPNMLKGIVSVPPSKSVAHRAIIAASLSGGECTIENVAVSKDIEATIECMRALGAKCSVNTKSMTVSVTKKKTYKVKNMITLDCGESGSTLRFLMPIALGKDVPVKFVGHGRLMQRPQTPYLNIFREKGIKYELGTDYIIIDGSLKSGSYGLPGNVSSQFITGLLFALPIIDGDSEIIVSGELESKGYVDLTIDMLSKFGIEIENYKYKLFKIKGGQKYKGCSELKIEADYSQAAFFLVADAIGCNVECLNLNPNSLQGDREILDIIKNTGARIVKGPNGGIMAKKTAVMHGITVDAKNIPDLVPIVAVLCSFCSGESRIINAGRLRHKESDRLRSTATELGRLGVDIVEERDGLKIIGRDLVEGNVCSSWNDHRIAMALSIAACRAEGCIEITGAEKAVTKSYPDFYKVYDRLAGNETY